MEERNQFLEKDGLFWESETHEWFNDHTDTKYAQRKQLPEVVAFVVRNKTTGEYDRVLMDKKTNEIIYDTKSLEQLGFKIDQLALIKKFE